MGLLIATRAVVLTLVLLGLAAPVATAATFTVTSTGDLPDRNLGDGDCKDTTDPEANAKCTLRAAIMQANASAADDTIKFDVGSGLITITPGSQLPPITQPVDLDGTSQPGWGGIPIVQLSGQSAPANTDGIRVTGGTGTRIRGLIVNRFRIGVGLEGPGSNVVTNTWVGTDASGLSAAPNRRSGVYVFNSPNNVIGGTTASARNVVSGNGVAGVGEADDWGRGIEIFGAGANGNKVLGNYVGTDITGSGTLANRDAGVWVGTGLATGTPANVDVGDGTAAGGNVISSNREEGVYVLDAPTTRIRGNLIGLGANGAAIGNGLRGIAIENAPNARIGGTTPGERNVVSANGTRGTTDPTVEGIEGIVVFGPQATNTVVQGNYIGTDLAGQAITDAQGASTGNFGDGIRLTTRSDLGGATDALVGGTTAAQRNVISGNGTGVAIVNRATHNRVEGNYIGTDKTGTVDLGNLNFGVFLFAADENTVGGTVAGTRNLISGNERDGIRIQGDQPTSKPSLRNKVQGNWIGVAQDGTTALPNENTGVAVLLHARENVIGFERTATDAQLATAKPCAQGPCNRVQHNKVVGVWIRSNESLRNTIRGNRLSDNAFLGIDISDGNPTPNDVDDADAGANDRLNFPVAVMSYTDVETATRRISGRVVGPNPNTLKIDVYSSPTADPIGAGEGRTWEASAAPDDTGSFTLELPAAVPGPFFTATATDQTGNTSEFSPVCDDPDGDGNPDGDADGLCDDWEINGIDYDGDGAADLPLNAAPFSANPAKKDVFVEVDYLDALFHDHEPEAGTLTDVVTAYASAPVDGGLGIAMHVTPGDADGVDDDIDEVEQIKTLSRGPGSNDDFVDLREGDPAEPCDGHFGSSADRGSGANTCWKRLGARALAFRYGIFGHSFEESPGSSGVADDGGDNFLVTLADWDEASFQRDGGGLSTCLTTSKCKRSVEAGTFMHEIGHTFLLGHAGRLGVDDDHNNKPNYLSVMNYTFQFARTVATRPLDYSRWQLSTLNETSLMEGAGIDNNAPPAGLASWRTAWTVYDAGKDKCLFRTDPAVGDLDWNHSGSINAAAVGPLGINEPDFTPNAGGEDCQLAGSDQVLRGHNDWPNLHLNHRDLEGWNELGAGSAEPNPAPELTDSEQQSLAEISDHDGDGVDNTADNCVTTPNPGQEDGDGDGIGDACQSGVDPPANTMLPAISGTPRDGETLTADRGTWTGSAPITYTYAWLSCNAAGAACAPVGSAATFVLGAAQVGRRMKVRVTGTNGAGQSSADSLLTAQVAAAPPVNTTLPRITGEARDGVPLHADAGVWSGTQPIAFAYRWRRCDAAGGACADIPGATAQDYTAGSADIGRRLRVAVDATNVATAAPVTASSAATDPVAAVALTATAAPVVAGTAATGQTLTTTTGSWTGSDPKSYAYGWRRCDADGAGCQPISGATAQSYVVTTADEGRRLRSRVTATNPAGSVAADSAAVGPVAAAPTGAGGGGGSSGPFAPLPPSSPGGAGPFTPGSGSSQSDTAAPVVTVRFARARLGVVRRRGLAVTVKCSEACVIDAQLVARAARARRASGSLLAGGARAARPAEIATPAQRRQRLLGRGRARLARAGTVRLTLRLTAAGRRATRRARRLTATLQVIARDPAGNTKTVTRAVRLRR